LVNGRSHTHLVARGLLPVIGLALVIAACSSEGNGRDTATTTSTGPENASTTSPVGASKTTTTPRQPVDCSPRQPSENSLPPLTDYDSLPAGPTSEALKRALSPVIPDTLTLAHEQELGSPDEPEPDVYLAFVDEQNRQAVNVAYQKLDPARAQSARAFWTTKGSKVEILDGACQYTPPSDGSQGQVIVISNDNTMGNVTWRGDGTEDVPHADLVTIAQAVANFVPPPASRSQH
jgi:hypothetical protein